MLIEVDHFLCHDIHRIAKKPCMKKGLDHSPMILPYFSFQGNHRVLSDPSFKLRSGLLTYFVAGLVTP